MRRKVITICACVVALAVGVGSASAGSQGPGESPPEGGVVWQVNDNSSNALAGNANWTDQSVEQSQQASGNTAEGGSAWGGDGGSGCGCEGGGDGGNADSSADASVSQEAENENATFQHADADSGSTIQVLSGNNNVDLTLLSHGDEGDVYQYNDNSSNATAANHNGTEQSIGQKQDASGNTAKGGRAWGGDGGDACDCEPPKHSGKKPQGKHDESCGCKGRGGDADSSADASVSQEAENENVTVQHADADSGGTFQLLAGNNNVDLPLLLWKKSPSMDKATHKRPRKED